MGIVELPEFGLGSYHFYKKGSYLYVGGPEFFLGTLRGDQFFSVVQRGDQIFFIRSKGNTDKKISGPPIDLTKKSCPL